MPHYTVHATAANSSGCRRERSDLVMNVRKRAGRQSTGYLRIAALPILVITGAVIMATQSGAQAVTMVNLGTAAPFGVLAGSAVTNTGPTVIAGDLGVSPGTSVTGFPPGIVGGTIHSADAVAAQAQSDLTNAYNVAAGETPVTAIPGFIGGGQTLLPGVYKATR